MIGVEMKKSSKSSPKRILITVLDMDERLEKVDSGANLFIRAV